MMLFAEAIPQLLHGCLKLVSFQHIHKLVHERSVQPQPIDLEIAGVGGGLIPMMHCVITKVLAEILDHGLAGAQIHGVIKLLHLFFLMFILVEWRPSAFCL